MDNAIETVAIVGVGLIGGSFALALRKAGFTGRIVGVSSARSVEAALEAGVISDGVDLPECARIADLIYLSQPIDQILLTLPALRGLLRPGCLVTDAGSTKAEIVRAASKSEIASQFLGGHPMAGKESRGIHSADADLFKGRPYVLTSTGAPISHELEFRSWLQRIGAVIVEMDAEQHDLTVAGTSHLPQLLATTLALTLSRSQNAFSAQVFGPGLLDMTRLALSAPEVWLSVLRTNRAAVKLLLHTYQSQLKVIESALEHDETFSELFGEAAHFARMLRD